MIIQVSWIFIIQIVQEWSEPELYIQISVILRGIRDDYIWY